VNSSTRSLWRKACFLLGFLALTSSASAADSGKSIADAAGSFPDSVTTVYAINSLSISASPDGPVVASISPSTSAAVLAVDGEHLKVRISGWQQGSGGRLVFFAPGRRIPVAEIGSDYKGALRLGASETDAATNQQWTQVSFEGYAARKQFVGSLDLLWRYADDLTNTNCTTCHARAAADRFTANQWTGIIRSKKDRVSADADQLALIAQYAQKHASDMVK
jgi:trimethylamine-N-oxide reductase (cytochrome c), cytochrome c-type subunit TorC